MGSWNLEIQEFAVVPGYRAFLMQRRLSLDIHGLPAFASVRIGGVVSVADEQADKVTTFDATSPRTIDAMKAIKRHH